MILNKDEHKIFVKGKQIHLTKTEFAILKQLLINSKLVVTKARLLDLISDDTQDCDENSLKVHISNIRKKIRKITDEEYIGFKMCEDKS